MCACFLGAVVGHFGALRQQTVLLPWLLIVLNVCIISVAATIYCIL
jgi:hypothetical protein